ncbi:putative dehydrogenase [Paenibacillus cellulosilyticus]|uniref:Putative dehydrogenase n=1 Tax=Paenibacillus cellulosilyticus TaxID=375489 RepID=A0A2V2YNB0_9BACL|nr:Gfo/Idh/MocA family oxidoreductase [Paenibacillus cellulosilyticus]PWV95912.1 putative dehydrogenase [Paenibacillus cellulosilyticus]QKS47778.1 Gfo/Idh/MocA family oxidoreductase [Paenibacillus cellulosilyticus]
MNMNSTIRIGLIGGGWRASYYLRIASMLPHLFHITGVVLRSPDKYSDFLAKWKVPVYRSAEELAEVSDFLVLAVSKTSAPASITELAAADIPVLAETPPATNLSEYEQLSAIAASNPRIQVAEQYPLLPHNQARTAYINTGKLGDVMHVQVSAGHGYHGISLIRKWLSIGTTFECDIIGRRFSLPIADTPHRGQASSNEVGIEQQEIAIFSFADGKSAVLDFARSQYFSTIRSNRILIRGSHGEIQDNTITRKIGPDHFETVTIQRSQHGQEDSLYNLSLAHLQAGVDVLYRNPFSSYPLSDEEIGIAEALLRMRTFLEEGTSFYSLSDALTDVRLGLSMEEAIANKGAVTVHIDLL